MNKTYFIKPSRSTTKSNLLNVGVLKSNQAFGIETSISLDTNILIIISRIVKEGNKLGDVKRLGLNNLINLLNKSPAMSACISPGLGLAEIPPGLAEGIRADYEVFCKKHLPNFIDTPNATNTKYSGVKNEYGFEDLPQERKGSLSLSYSSLIYLNLVYRKVNLKPFEKFGLFIKLLEEKVGVLSAIEIEIAKYCFAEPSNEFKDALSIRKAIRNNFVKTNKGKLPKSAEDILKIAFNGSCDIFLLHAANLMDQKGLDGVRQDSWIATLDKKLFDFANVFHHVNLLGQTGEFAVSSELKGFSEGDYWSRVNDLQMELTLNRLNLNFDHIDMDNMIGVANAAVTEARNQSF